MPQRRMQVSLHALRSPRWGTGRLLFELSFDGSASRHPRMKCKGVSRADRATVALSLHPPVGLEVGIDHG